MTLSEQRKTQLMKQLHAIVRLPPYAGATGLLLAVSGGRDSMVMLDVFRRLQHVHRSPLRVAHFHHGTGAYADDAQHMVRAYCATHGFDLETFSFQAGPGNFEYEAASFRHEQLARACRPGEWILIGHHLQDQAETFLQTVVRGAGISTPIGMVAQHERRLRPLLACDPALLQDHAERCQVPYLEDPSNQDPRFFRNLIRHQVLPPLRSVHQGFEARIHGLCTDLALLREGLDQEARRLFEAHNHDGLLDRAVFTQTPQYLWDFILKAFWEKYDVTKPNRTQNNQIHQWLANGTTGSFAHAGKYFWCDRDGLVWEDPPAKNPFDLTPGVATAWGAWQVRSVAQTGTCQLLPPSKRPEHEKKWLQAQFPRRLRANLPDLVWEGRALLPSQWLRAENPIIQVQSPSRVNAMLEELRRKCP